MSDIGQNPAQQDIAADRRPQRVRHELRFRLLEVRDVERLTLHMVRVSLGGDELEGFYSPGFDDHAKIFFPAPGEAAPARPEMGDKGPIFPEDRPRPIMRDFTPRYDAGAGVLVLDFALHDSGPASDWARQASLGQKLVVGGPRGSFIVPVDFDWHLLIGDETALPAIARRLAELPAGARAVVLAQVDGPADELAFETQADAAVHWVHRDATPAGTDRLAAALDDLSFPAGDYHAWVACESATAKLLRQKLIDDHGAHPKWVRASGYWRQGAAGTHDSFDE